MARRATLKDKNIIITGASSGLGRAMAIKCAHAGANLILSGRSRAELENTKALCGTSDNLHIAIADVTEANDCRNLIDFGLSKLDSLDHLICSAGVSMWSRFDEVEKPAVFANLMSVNYLGTVYCTQYALPYLKASKGMITSIASLQSLIGVPLHTGYSAAKHALRGFFEALRLEIGNDVHILVAYPYWISGTNLRRNALAADGGDIGEAKRSHGKDAISTEECGDRIIKAITRKKNQIIIPSKLKILPFLQSVSPGLVRYLIKRKLEQQNRMC